MRGVGQPPGAHDDEGRERAHHQGRRHPARRGVAGYEADDDRHHHDHRGEQAEVEQELPEPFAPEAEPERETHGHGQRGRRHHHAVPADRDVEQDLLLGHAQVVEFALHRGAEEDVGMGEHLLAGLRVDELVAIGVRHLPRLGILGEHGVPGRVEQVPAGLALGHPVDEEPAVAHDVAGVAPQAGQGHGVHRHAEHDDGGAGAEHPPVVAAGAPEEVRQPQRQKDRQKEHPGPGVEGDGEEQDPADGQPPVPHAHRVPDHGEGEGAEGDADHLGHRRRPVDLGEPEDADEQGKAGHRPQVTRHRPRRQPRCGAGRHRPQDQRQPQVQVGDRQPHGQEHGVERAPGVVEVEVAEEQQPLGAAEVDVGVGVGHAAADHPPPRARLPCREQGDAERGHGADQAGGPGPAAHGRRQQGTVGGHDRLRRRATDQGAEGEVQVLDQPRVEPGQRRPVGRDDPRRPQHQEGGGGGHGRDQPGGPVEAAPPRPSPLARRRRAGVGSASGGRVVGCLGGREGAAHD